tara:strand:- start:287 stop:493 length:207 start_codon:yes stop_codon:yes gene_type:complete
MSRNKLKRKQDKQKKKDASKKVKLSKQRAHLLEKKKLEKQTSDMQREMERLQNRLSGVTIRKPKEASS